MTKGAIIKKEWLNVAATIPPPVGFALIRAICRLQWGEDPGDLHPRAAAALALIRMDLDRSAEMRRRVNLRWEKRQEVNTQYNTQHNTQYNTQCDTQYDTAEGARAQGHMPGRAPYKDARAKRGINNKEINNNNKEKNIQKKESPDVVLFPAKQASPPESPSGLPFERFWDIYGLKIDKKKCRDVYDRLTAADKAAIGAVLIDYVGSTNINGRYPCRKHPLTWLRGRCWEDEGICHRKQVLVPGI